LHGAVKVNVSGNDEFEVHWSPRSVV